MKNWIALVLLLSSFDAYSMCLQRADFKSFNMLKNSSTLTRYGRFEAIEVKYYGLMDPAAVELDRMKINNICNTMFGQDYSFANVESRRSPQMRLTSSDLYIELYNSVTRKISQRIPLIRYSGNTISYACVKPLKGFDCENQANEDRLNAGIK